MQQRLQVRNKRRKCWNAYSSFIILSFVSFIGSTITGFAQNVGIGTTTPHPTARLQIYDTSRGILIPQLTTEQRNAIQNPAHTLMIFNVDSFCLEVYDTLTQRWYPISCPRLCRQPLCTPTIDGPAFACTGDTAIYTASGCTNAFYEWSVPPGWTIVSGQGTPTLMVIPDTTDGIITVTPCNQCGCGTPTTLSVIADTCNYLCLAIGGSSYDYAYDVAITSDGGYILTGSTQSFGVGSYDAYFVKVDANGNIQWTRTLGGSSWEYAIAITTTTDGGYAFAGYTYTFGQLYYDVYVGKLDANGNVQWTRTIGGSSYDYGYDIIQTTDGGYAIAGYTQSFGAGGVDVYVIKLDANGNVQWTRTIGGSSSDYGYAITQTTDGGYAITGSTYSFGAGGWDVYVIKLDANGAIQWTRTIGGPSQDYGFDIIQTTDSGYAITGYTISFGQGGYDVYVIKLDANGNLQWTRTIGGTGHDYGLSIVQTSDEGFAIGGYTGSFGAGSYDFYLVKLDANGNLQWTRTVGGPSNEYARTVINYKGYVMAGYTNSYGYGVFDLYLVHLDGLGNLKSCPGGCQVSTGGVTDTGGTTNTGGTANTGGVSGSGGLTGSGGNLTNICP